MARKYKVSDRHTLINILKEHGFSVTESKGKHDKWGHADGRSVSVQRQHSHGKFSRFCAQEILKTAKIE